MLVWVLYATNTIPHILWVTDILLICTPASLEQLKSFVRSRLLHVECFTRNMDKE